MPQPTTPAPARRRSRPRALLRAAAPLAAVAAGVVLAPGVPAVAAGGTGTVAVHVTVEGKPSPKQKVCATTKKAPAKGSVVGKCGVTNKAGNTTLRAVRPGRWWITIYDGSTPAQSAMQRARVTAGRTTHFTDAEQVG